MPQHGRKEYLNCSIVHLWLLSMCGVCSHQFCANFVFFSLKISLFHSFFFAPSLSFLSLHANGSFFFFFFFCYIPWPLQKCGWNVSHSIRCFRFHPAPTHIHLYPCRAYKSIKAAPTNGDYIDAGNAHVTTLSLGYLPFVTEKAHCVQYETKIDEQPRKKPF